MTDLCLAPPDRELREVLERHRLALGGLEALRRTAIRRTAWSRRGVNDFWVVKVSDDLFGRFLCKRHPLGQGHMARDAFDGASSWIESLSYDTR